MAFNKTSSEAGFNSRTETFQMLICKSAVWILKLKEILSLAYKPLRGAAKVYFSIFQNILHKTLILLEG